jgi:peptidoglycan/xylan/chitin deacetylase (PgdA/CDA1 family)
MRIALTIDNGPDVVVTPRVLDVLDRRGIKGTFFVVGERLLVPEHRALARAAREAGHLVGNHTYTHTTPFGLLENPQDAVDEITRSAELLGDLTGDEPLFRPSTQGGPMDARTFNPAAVKHLTEGGYTCVLWNNLPEDWIDPIGWPERAARTCKSLGDETSVIVIHDILSEAMLKLDGFLDEMLSNGATFVQDFPDSCVPIRRGQPTPLLKEITARPIPQVVERAPS